MLRLDIRRAWAEVPVIRGEPLAMYVNAIGNGIVRAIIDASWMGGESGKVTIKADGELVGSFSSFADGIRSTTIEVEVSARSVGQFWESWASWSRRSGPV
jgi:hypothetical protein